VRARHARLSSAQYAVRGVLHASTDKRRVGLVCAPRRGRASRRRGVGSAQWANSLPSVERRKSERRSAATSERNIIDNSRTADRAQNENRGPVVDTSARVSPCR
jgi:hypothetical protein